MPEEPEEFTNGKGYLITCKKTQIRYIVIFIKEEYYQYYQLLYKIDSDFDENRIGVWVF